jgi:hypothetical protein
MCAMEDTMRRIIATIALLLGTAVAAQAVPQTMYKDLIRPNGHKRSESTYAADVDACYRQTGGSRYLPDSAAMKKCMLSHGYRFVWQRGYTSDSRRSASSHYDPTFDFPTQPTAEPQVPDPNTFPTLVVPSSPVFDGSGNMVPGTGP